MKTVIFDFDGTIADSTYVWEKVDSDFFAKRGMIVPSDYVEAISTMSFYSGAVYTKDKYQLRESVEDIMAEWNSHALYEYENNVRLKPFAKEYIKKLYLENTKIGLATASNPEFYMPVLKREGIADCFSAFADGSDNVKNKDFPDIYMLCAERMNSKLKECRVYEDVLKGIRSAKSVGMETIAVYDNHNKEQWNSLVREADSFILTFKDL